MAISVRDFATKNPRADYEAITARFGTPQQIAASCVEDMDTQELAQHLKIGRRIVTIVGVAALTVVLLWVGAVGYALVQNQKSTTGYHVITLIEDIENGE